MIPSEQIQTPQELVPDFAAGRELGQSLLLIGFLLAAVGTYVAVGMALVRVIGG